MASASIPISRWCCLAFLLGLASVLLGLVSIVSLEVDLQALTVALSILALLIGVAALRQIKRRTPFIRGRSLARWGIGLVVAFWLLAPAHQPFRARLHDAAARTYATNYMMQIVLAMHNYHDTHKHLPSPAICDPDGKPLLSWRVAILPFIEEQKLYDRFKLDEQWDSPHNIKLLPEMPVIYGVPPGAVVIAEPGTTFCQVIVGPGAAFETGRELRMPGDFPDGMSNTILVVHGGRAVPWTKPEDLTYDPKGPLPDMGGMFPGTRSFWDLGFARPKLMIVGLGDASVRSVNLDRISEPSLRHAITRNGGEAFTSDW